MRGLVWIGLPVLVAMALVLAWTTQRERRREVVRWEERLGAQGRLRSDALATHIATLRREVLFLAALPPVPGIARATWNRGFDPLEQTPIDLWKRRLQQIFAGYATVSPNVVQLRYIGVADNGLELMRVNREGQKVSIVPPAELQPKGDREYFRATQGLKAGETYISDLNLNREHGRIEEPHRPVLRATTPVFADGTRFGMIVINLDAAGLLDELRQTLPANVQAYLMDGRGNFLLHPDASETFGSDLGTPHRWQDEFTPLAGAEGAGPGLRSFTHHGERLEVFTADIAYDEHDPARHFTLALAIPDAAIDAAVAQSRNNVLSAMLVGLLLIGGFAYFYGRQREQTQMRQARLAAMVSSSEDAIIAKTLDGVVVDWNGGAERMFGYTAAEAIGRPLEELIVPAEYQAEEASILTRVARGEVVPQLETVRRRRDGSRLPVSVTVSPIRTAQGLIVGAAKTARDITERKQAEENLKKTRAQLKTFVAKSPLSVAMFDRDMRYIACSHRWLADYGRGQSDLTGRSHYELYPDLPGYWKDVHRRALAGATINEEEDLWRQADGSERWLRWGVQPWLDETGQIGGLIISADEITARKRAEQERERLLDQLQQLNAELEGRVQERTAALSATLREREILLKEMHHRVKNNLQVITSLIRLQSRQLTDAAGRTALQECQARIQAIALIHEKLYQSKNFADIPFSVYVRDMAASVFQVGGVPSSSVQLELALEEVSLPVDKAIPCGLILNELITNALKHAFPHGRQGTVRVALRHIDQATLMLEVADDGVGMKAELDIGSSESLGLLLVRTLAEQLGGRIEHVPGAGTCLRLSFPA